MKYELDYSNLRSDLWVSFTFSALLLMYVVHVLSLANVKYSATIYRVTDVHLFSWTFTGSALTDSILLIGLSLLVTSFLVSSKRYSLLAPGLFVAAIVAALYSAFTIEMASVSTAPAALSILFLQRRKLLGSRINFQTLAITTVAIVTAFELAAFLRWATYPVFPSKIFGDASWAAAQLEMQMFQTVGLLSPFIMILIVYAFLYRHMLKNIPFANLFAGSSIKNEEQKYPDDKKDENSTNIFSRTSHRHLLAIAFGLSIILSVYPYLPSVNPEFKEATVDEKFYVTWMGQLGQTDDPVASAFTEVSNGDRPLTLLLISSLQSVTGLPAAMIVRFLPLILGPMLIAAVYHFVRLGTNNRKKVASLAALLTVASFHFVVGMYAGFFANWLALVTMYLSMLFLVAAWRESNGKNNDNTVSSYTAQASRNKIRLYIYAALFLSTSVLTLFIHVYTWSFLIAASILFVAISYFKERKDADRAKVAFLIGCMIAASIGIDVVRTYWGAAGGLESDVKIAESTTGIEHFFARWNNLNYTFNAYVGGYFASAVMLSLALVWVWRARMSNAFDRMLLASLFVGALPILFGDHTMQTRIFYNMPLHIPAAITLYGLANTRKVNPVLASLLSAAIMIHLLTYAFGSTANLYLILPE